jgi:rsbT co-antagonist protein RsbR
MPSAEQSLMRAMGLSTAEIEARKNYVSLTHEEGAALKQARGAVEAAADGLVEGFFGYIAKFPEARGLMMNADLLARARREKRAHLIAMVSGDYGAPYVEQRLVLAHIYSRAGLELAVFLGAFNHLLGAMQPILGEQFGALRKVAFFDIALIVDAIVHERERVIRLQSEAIRELSTPVLQLQERLLLMPLIGVVDTHRAQLIMESALSAIRTRRARVLVMDVTGVATVDSKVANHLLQTVAAAKLMGASVIVTGLSAEVAQSLVALGIDLRGIHAVGDLQGGLEDAQRMLAR